jgi:hypothetical protein
MTQSVIGMIRSEKIYSKLTARFQHEDKPKNGGDILIRSAAGNGFTSR